MSDPPFPAISAIADPLAIWAIPRIGAIGAALPATDFRLDSLPPAVKALFGKPAAWLEALKAAIAAGIKNPKRLADLIFFMRHPERMKAGVGKPIDPGEAFFVWLRAEWLLDETIVARTLDPSLKPTVFQAEQRSRDYQTYVAAPTTGRISLMPHGRNLAASGTIHDELEALNRMQEAVKDLGPGDALFIANWQFIPSELDLTLDRNGLTTWLDLLKAKAEEGVVIRVIISRIPIADFMSPLAPLDTAIGQIAEKARDNFKYIVSAHKLPLGTHHQKFLVARKGRSKAAFCGGLDISIRRAPNAKRTHPSWSTGFVWHDVHSRAEGRIVHDLEREFVARWNREKDAFTATRLAGWKPFETLDQSPLNSADRKSGKNPYKVQMLRTISVGQAPADFRRDDIWQGYFRLIGRASRLLYLENQYFREPRLADAIVRQAQSQPDLQLMVLVSTGTDDNPDLSTELGYGLRLAFFTRLFNGIPAARRRVYSIAYPGGLLHSKLIMADDEVLSVGSANANPRGFVLDSELNLMIEAPDLVQDFRHRLWAHNLGIPAGEVARWKSAEFFTKWDKVAQFNRDKEAKKKPQEMVGDSIIPFDPVNPKDPPTSSEAAYRL